MCTKSGVAMGRLSRQFQHVIMENRIAGTKSLCSVDLTRQLFDANTVRPPSAIGDRSVHDCTPKTLAAGEAGNQKNEQAAVASKKMKRIRLPSPIVTFQTAPNETCKIDCFPLVDRKMIWADHFGRAFFFDAETRQMDILPKLHKSKRRPFSLFVPNPDADSDYHQGRFGSSLFVMERIPEQEPEGCSSSKWSEQFEAFIYRLPAMASFSKTWQCQLLPPPPYVRALKKYWHSSTRPEISSYGLLSGVSGGSSSHIFISVEGVGTYCMDTARHRWRRVGRWILPFHGRVEYVPELKLWFGFDRTARHFAAADISAMGMDSKPQLVGSWRELYCLPEEWKECRDPQLVSLGSGRFCIVRFFHTGAYNGDPGSDVDQDVAVFTGVEVVPCPQDANGGSGEVGLQMIPHKSLCHMCNGITVSDVF